MGDRAKLLEASQRMKETMPEVVAAGFEEDSHEVEDSHEEEDGDEDGVDGLYGLRR